MLTRLQYAGDVERLNDDLYDYAASIAAGQLLPAGTPSLAKRFTTHLYRIDGDWRQVGYRSCPGIGGFNIVSLPLNTSSVTFEGLQPGSSLAPDDPGEWRTGADGDKVGGVTANYNTTLVKPGWRWGLVVAMKDGSAQKFPMHSEASGTVSVEVPDDADGLYLVVLGAPGVQCYNPQDYDESNDLQFPYRFKVTKN